MKKQRRYITSQQLAWILIGGFILTNVCALGVHTLGLWPVKVILFFCLMSLPGIAMLRAMRIVPRLFILGVVYSLGLSVLVMMISGLAANQILPVLGLRRPLEFLGSFGMWDVITAMIMMIALLNHHPAPVGWPKWVSKATLVLTLSGLLLPLGAVLGAFQVNNNGPPLVALFTLGYSAVLIVYSIVLRQRLSDEALGWFIFVLGLSILLMTSLRGWGIVGHDIEREFRVFSLTDLYGRWDIGLYRDPYNACLSITILPEMLSHILKIPGVVVFKVLLQIIFAACPVVIFVLLRRYVARLGAIIGSLLFVCYPTFITDAAMLTRQGVAYLFFALALLVISNQTQTKRCKLLFVIMSLGVVLSHYSTAYMYVGLFAAAVLFKFGLSWWLGRRKTKVKYRPLPTVVSPLFAGLLFLLTFVWYTQVTATSTGLVTTVKNSLAKIPSLFSDDNKSTDTSAALFFSGAKSQAQLYESYLSHGYKGGTDPALLINYLPVLTNDDMPLTPLGKKARSVGIDPYLTTSLRQNFAKLLQLLAVVSVGYGLFRLIRGTSSIGVDFVCLSLAGLAMLALIVVLPVISLNYGILRAFQQALIFLLLPIIIMITMFGQRLRSGIRTSIATVGIVTLFLLFTNWFAQLLGGVSPSLSLNNSGLYYGLYYTTAADRQSFEWLKHNVAQRADVRGANFNRALMTDPNYPFKRSGILPSQITAASYIYLDEAQVKKQRLYTYFESNSLIMTFPMDYYELAKNQIYSTSATRIYR